ncbi:hypothetical protein N7527_003311 [Penicillium freii]|nr:hypothetical protein N7527_003311 [Penicillium freii]
METRKKPNYSVEHRRAQNRLAQRRFRQSQGRSTTPAEPRSTHIGGVESEGKGGSEAAIRTGAGHFGF